MRLAAVHPSSEDSLPREEIDRRRSRQRAVLSSGTELVDYYTVGNSIFNAPFGKAGFVNDIVERVAQRIRDAAAQRPDAIVVLGGVEPGVAIARKEIRDIPIIGVAQSTYNAAFALGEQIGHKLGMLVYESSIVEAIWGQARYYKADWMVTDIRDIGISLPNLYPQRAEVRKQIITVSKGLVADGATMIFANGLSMVPSSMSADELSTALGGIPVLDGEQTALHTAEMFARLKVLGASS